MAEKKVSSAKKFDADKFYKISVQRFPPAKAGYLHPCIPTGEPVRRFQCRLK